MRTKKIIKKMHVKTGDTVQIISGSEKGKVGKIIKVSPKNNKIIIENLNIATKHLKTERNSKSGKIVKIEKPINSSKVILYNK
uniref:Large ribosomal subunit protein uL24c n=1 Tax=Gracilaria salicornia TaxID=172968 RepID=W8DVK4_9FLOR|nr:50S ribosomal protein L24 [Gracilaria salicornia]AHH24572.1 50S ribosomal protein L24 [Gracilaria salicornia]UAD87656.1 ribosomal protein L24 [Gracilaria salicornia]